MGFSLDAFFDDLRNILANSRGVSDVETLKNLYKCVEYNYSYAQKCGCLQGEVNEES